MKSPLPLRCRSLQLASLAGIIGGLNFGIISPASAQVSSACSTIYAIDSTTSSSKIYTLNTGNGAFNSIGTAGFLSAAAAVQPSTGKLYYISRNTNGTQQVGVWDPTTKTNSTLPNTFSTGSATPIRAAFNQAGRLFVATNTQMLYEINPSTGALISANQITLSDGTTVPGGNGDMAFDGDGALFFFSDQNLYSIDTNTKKAYLVATGPTGTQFNSLAFAPNGSLYGYSGSNNTVYSINTNTGAIAAVGSPTLANGAIGTDFASCAAPASDIRPTKTATKVGGSTTSSIQAGDTIEYTIIVPNSGDVPATNVLLSDAIPNGTTYVAGSTTLNSQTVTDSTGGVFPYASSAAINSPSLKPGVVGVGSSYYAVIKYRVKVNTVNPPASVSNQGTVFYLGGPTAGIKTDDPSTTTQNDATVTTIAPTAFGYKTAKLTSDADASGTITPGDTVTWTITYINTSGVDIPNFQVTDVLSSGVTLTGTPTVIATGTGQVTPIINNTFGSSSTSLFSAPVMLKAGGVLTVNLPTLLGASTANTIQTNQATATGSNLPTANIPTDNIDNTTLNLPAGVTVSLGSINQTQTANLDPTSIAVVTAPSVAGYKSVRLTNDADTSLTITPGDTLTWTVIYTNKGTVDVPNFQVTDALPSGMTIAGTPSITTLGLGQSTPTVNSSYSGAGNNTLFSSGVTLKAGSSVIINIPVTVNTGSTGTKTNQATATGNNLPLLGVKTDNVDNTTLNLPAGITISPGSITQAQTATIDATSVIVNTPITGLALGFKSVKLTQDLDVSGGPTPGDLLTWTITYTNTGTADIKNFQITDSLASGLSAGGTPVITATGLGQVTPIANSAYDGVGNNALFNTAFDLKAGSSVTVNLPVKINANVAANTLTNQASGSGSNLPAVSTDAIDSATSGLPLGITVPSGSIPQIQTPGIDLTTVQIIPVGSCSIGGGTADAAIAPYISPEVRQDTATSRNVVDTLDDSWRSASGAPTSGTIQPWFGTSSAPGSSSSFVYRDPSTAANINTTVDLVKVAISGADTCAGQLGGASAQLDSFNTLQESAPRPASLYNIAGQPPFWNQISASTDSKRSAVRLTFDQPVKSFGAWFGDLETRTTNGTPALLRLLDANGNRIGNDIVIQPATIYDNSITATTVDQTQCGSSASDKGCGNKSTRWVSFVDNSAVARVKQVLVIVGDDDQGDDGDTERISFIGATIVPGSPNVLLVKRITAINGSTKTQAGDDLSAYKNEPANPYDDNTIEPALAPNAPSYPTADTDKWPSPIANFLVGGTSGGTIRPGDELEYTIYFLSTGGVPAKNVLFCDRVPDNTTFIPNAFSGSGSNSATDQGILLSIGSATSPNPIALTNVPDGDMGQFIPAGIDPASIFPNLNCGGPNSNGAVVVNLGNLPNSTSPGMAGSYGFVRFRAKVK